MNQDPTYIYVKGQGWVPKSVIVLPVDLQITKEMFGWSDRWAGQVSEHNQDKIKRIIQGLNEAYQEPFVNILGAVTRYSNNWNASALFKIRYTAPAPYCGVTDCPECLNLFKREFITPLQAVWSASCRSRCCVSTRVQDILDAWGNTL